MKKAILTATLTALTLVSSLATAAVGVNHNGPQLNPFAHSNAQVQGNEVVLELVSTVGSLNAKEVNPLYKVVSPVAANTSAGTDYTVRVNH